MNNIIDNKTLSDKTINNSRNHFNKHLKIGNNKSIIKNKKKSYLFLTTKTNPKNILYEQQISLKKKNNEEKSKFNYENNIIPYRNNSRMKTQSKTNSISLISKITENSNPINSVKQYLIGSDINLPFNGGNNYYEHSILNTFSSTKTFSPIRRSSDNNKNFRHNSFMENKVNYRNNNCREFYKTNFKKRIIYSSIRESKKKLINLNRNKKYLEKQLYKTINNNKYSNRTLKTWFKPQQNHENEINNKFYKDKIDSFFSFDKNKIKKKIKNNKLIIHYSKENKNNNKSENHLFRNRKIEDFKNEKELLAYNKAKDLVNNPDSVIYVLYQKIKKQKFDKEGNIKKLDLKKRFEEYKKDLNKLEQSARFELFNLKKERIIGNEINMKGKVNSANTFFNLAFIRGDY
jgi:hypothetical protein